MSFISHINELRKRLLISVIALAVTTMASFAFSQQLAEILAKPIGGLSAMFSIEVTENITAFYENIVVKRCGVGDAGHRLRVIGLCNARITSQ
jgi:Sec-independent protein secretion pathway component TatC